MTPVGPTDRLPILLSGAGIAGLTLALCLKRSGREVQVIERAPSVRTDGYMMDFFGTGWDVAQRIGIEEQLRSVRYPIDDFEYVDGQGKTFMRMPIARMRDALRGRYVYLRRQDLERILFERATAEGVGVRFGTSIGKISDAGDRVEVTFEDGTSGAFSLVIGADGVRSRVRELVFGPYERYARFLGYSVAAFQTGIHGDIGRALKIHEETDRLAGYYPLSAELMDATLVFRSIDRGFVPHGDRLNVVREAFRGAGWITPEVLAAVPDATPLFFDSVTQIDVPRWHAGRVALIGDAAGCLTLLAGQGSHMAMAGAFVLANELARSDRHEAAFAATERVMRGAVARKQREARGLARIFLPSVRSRPWLRRLAIRTMFSAAGLRLTISSFGAKSILANYP
jgi:2-polyprenyl-6-methoxyphenol hydroxylase-like FAD-dependent oxidoreductase